MDVLLITVVRHPLDVRLQQQTRALTEAGHHVRLAAPWHAHGAVPPEGTAAIDLPRAEGRARMTAVRRARRYLKEHATTADVVVVADLELVPAALATCPDRAVWDVRTDAAAALAEAATPGLRQVASSAAPATRLAVTGLERLAERCLRLILTDEAQAARFTRAHPVVPDLPWAPRKAADPDERRVVHLGHHSRRTGASLLLGLSGRLPGDVTFEAIGPADDDVAPLLTAAADEGWLAWTPWTDPEQARQRLDGAGVGLSLTLDSPVTRRWRPDSLYEYMARGVPSVATATPAAHGLLRATGAGLVVADRDLGALERAVRWLLDHDDERRAVGAAAHAAARADYDWAPHAERFVALLEDVPAGGRRWPDVAGDPSR